MGSHAITPSPESVELDYYKERNAVIHSRNELLEKENRDLHNQIRDLKIQISREAHPAGKALPQDKPPRKPGNGKFDEAFEELTKGLSDEQKDTFKKLMEGDED